MMHFLLSSMSMVYVLTTPIPKYGGNNPIVEQLRRRAKWDNDEYVCKGLILNDQSWNNTMNLRFTQHKMNMDESIKVSCIIDKLPPSWKDLKYTLKHLKDELTLVELGSHLHIDESLKAQDNDNPEGNNVAGPLVVNMVEHKNSSGYNDNRGKRKHHDTKADPNKKLKVACWNNEKPRHLKKDYKDGNVGKKPMVQAQKGSGDGSFNSLKDKNMFNKSLQVYYVTYVSETYFVQDDDVAWWVGSGANVNVCKDRCWFKTYESLIDGSILHMKMSQQPWCMDVVALNIVSDNIGSAFMPTSKLNNSILWHARLGHVHFKRMKDMSKDGLILAFHMDTEKEINDEMEFIIDNNTWVLADLTPGCKWIFKRKLKVDGTVEKFKARLVIQGFRQKAGIYYFDTYALVAHISTIRLLIAMASIHSIIIHQMDVKIAFLNGELEEEEPKQWHQKFDEVVLSNGYLLNQLDKYVYSKFDESGKGVIICLYVDDMLIFGTDQVWVNLKKEFLSSSFSMKDMGEADVILVSTPMDTSKKLMPNNGQAVSQLECSRVIACLMYAMTYTRPDIAFAMCKLSMYTSCTDASWISNTKDNSSTSDWVFLLGGGAICSASKKQTCITCLTIKSKFVALAAAGKEA
nr:zinc finger, CCHC-type [Tanacetum cinerariifolium]